MAAGNHRPVVSNWGECVEHVDSPFRGAGEVALEDREVGEALRDAPASAGGDLGELGVAEPGACHAVRTAVACLFARISRSAMDRAHTSPSGSNSYRPLTSRSRWAPHPDVHRVAKVAIVGVAVTHDRALGAGCTPPTSISSAARRWATWVRIGPLAVCALLYRPPPPRAPQLTLTSG
jgi:hypothetical protein